MKRSSKKYVFLVILATISLLALSCGSENKGNNNSTSKLEQQTPNITENKSVENNTSNPQNTPIANSQTNQTTEVTQCQLTESPVLKGFSLGQTVDDVDKRIQGFKDSYEKEKETSPTSDKKTNFVLINSGTLFGESNNIKDFSLVWHFLDDKIMALTVKYLTDNSSDIKNFVNKMSDEYKLPKNGWKYNNEQSAELSCNNFQINVSTHLQSGPSIMIIDTVAEKEKVSRMK